MVDLLELASAATSRAPNVRGVCRQGGRRDDLQGPQWKGHALEESLVKRRLAILTALVALVVPTGPISADPTTQGSWTLYPE
jgi:hypothetical protein